MRYVTAVSADTSVNFLNIVIFTCNGIGPSKIHHVMAIFYNPGHDNFLVSNLLFSESSMVCEPQNFKVNHLLGSVSFLLLAT